MRNERDIRHDAASGAWFGKSMPVSRDEMEGRVWRFGELVPSPRAFLDCALPGHVRTLYSALGAGADDEQLEGTAVEQAVNYHIDFVKASPGNGAALHSHGSEETFVALTGRWEVYWGDDGEESVVLAPFDGMVVPDGILRGFRNVSETEALLLIRALAPAAMADVCVSAQARDLLLALLAAQRRSLLACENDRDPDPRGSHTLVSARALLALARDGDDAVIYERLDAYADNSELLGNLLRALSAAAEEAPDRAAVARRIWPRVVRHVLELDESGYTPFRDAYHGDMTLAALIPNTTGELPFLYREIDDTPNRMVGPLGAGIRGRCVAGTRSGKRDVCRSVDQLHKRT